MKYLAGMALSIFLAAFLPAQGTGQLLRARDIGIPTAWEWDGNDLQPIQGRDRHLIPTGR